ncbi:hypothetical protein QS460_05085 [Liquorilactobacillus mali]|uniref:hypothetical protein n=1 Tax=Liquorilactobacillus mali TaxID=1618 RepID=UPI00265577F3|nr:hypothetical protein [Liquorilactobacillus mali]MDN7145299.1 hypothetical protein [Liquorilactobacillus mali]
MILTQSELPNGEIAIADYEGKSLFSDINYYFFNDNQDLVCADDLADYIHKIYEVKLPNTDIEFCEGWLFAEKIDFELIELEEIE